MRFQKEILVLLFSVAVGMYAVSNDLAIAGKPSSTPPPELCPGRSIEVNVDHPCGMTKWVQVTDSAAVSTITSFQQKALGGIYKELDRGKTVISWIGGTVIVDPTAEHGFYFEPTTVRVAEVAAEGLQTSTCIIAQCPEVFSGGLWYIQYLPLEIRDL